MALARAGVLIFGLSKGRGGEAADQGENEGLVDRDHGRLGKMKMCVVVVVVGCSVCVCGMGGVLHGGRAGLSQDTLPSPLPIGSLSQCYYTYCTSWYYS